MEVEPCGRFEWERIIRRVGIPSQQKYLALTLSTYGDADGTRVRPGVERLALVMKVTERTVIRNMGALRDAGFILRTKKGNRHREEADVYRLTVPDNLLDWPMLPPSEVPEDVESG